MRRGLFFLFCCVLAIPFSIATDSVASNKIIGLATTTSVENSRLLEYLLPKFQEQYS